MMNRLYGFIAASLLILVAACNSDYSKTPSGIVYKIFRTGTGEKIKNGQFLKVHFKTQIGDSIITNTWDALPGYGKYDSSMPQVYDFVDFLGQMNIGDSAVYSRSVDSLVKKGMLRYGGRIQPGSLAKSFIKVSRGFKDETELNTDYMDEMENIKKKEVVLLENYMKEKNLRNAVKTPGGAFVFMEKTGAGPKADSGMQVAVNYTGRLMSGKAFDSNTDSAFGHMQPLKFVVGQGQMVKGWDEGMRFFNQGGKGKILIPSSLGYGPQSPGEDVPPFSNLIFDIEVLSVQPAVSGPQEPHLP